MRPLNKYNTVIESFSGVIQSDVAGGNNNVRNANARIPDYRPLSQATGQNKKLFDGLQQKLGMVPNLAKLLANSPTSLKAYLGWGATLSEGVLPAALREQIAIAVANTNGCDYCVSAHTLLGSLNGVAAADLKAAQTGEASDPKSAAALAFAVAVVQKRGHLTTSAVEDLRSVGFSDSEIIEIVAVIAVNLFTNYFNHIAATEIDFPVVHSTPPAQV